MPWRDNFMNETYIDLCKKINHEYKKIKNPSVKDLSLLSKKFNIDNFVDIAGYAAIAGEIDDSGSF